MKRTSLQTLINGLTVTDVAELRHVSSDDVAVIVRRLEDVHRTKTGESISPSSANRNMLYQSFLAMFCNHETGAVEWNSFEQYVSARGRKINKSVHQA